MRAFTLSILALWVTTNFAWAQKHIVIFKQTPLELGSLDHGAIQQALKSANEKNMKQLEDWLGTRAQKVKDLWLIRGAVVELEAEAAKQLKAQSWVQGVYEDKLRPWVSPRSEMVVGKTLNDLGPDAASLWGLEAIGARKLHAEFPTINGSGIRVGVLDTGVQSRHPELPVTTHFQDFVSSLANPYDDHGHGTHVSGTISGVNVGVARRATLIHGKIFSAAGSGLDSTILSGMQWMYDPDGDPATNDYPHVVSNSWGGGLPQATAFDIEQFAPYVIAIQTWINGGIIPVFAAGNSGSAPNGFPGGLPEPISVGAFQADGNIAEFSSRGPNAWRTHGLVLTLLKPDISAPGVNIASAFPGNKFAAWAGTSMATPHVTGTIALMLQANPKLKYADIKEILMATSGKKMDIAFGYGTLNAYEAVKKALARRP